ncbi:LacI family transcriptional regulator [Ruminococcaceae bacterium OttesenSCG-928-I18]|nr:LacI family transcriptional regulator [Ruminococcaceae bacterium OttesenSCG-928-I18]
MAKSITLKEVAARAGVSQPLASKVLNGKECRLSEEKRKRILDVARECGYRTKASSVVPFPSDGIPTLAFLQANLEYGFFYKLADEVSREAYRRGYRMLLFNTNEDPVEERRCLQYCVDHKVDGILVNPCDNQENLDMFDSIEAAGIPLVFIDRGIYGRDCPFITSDNENAAYRLTEALIQRGHEDILFLFHGEVLYTSVTKERYDGYASAMKANNLHPVKELIFSRRPIEYQPIADLDRYSAIVLSTSADIYKLQEIMARTDSEGFQWEVGVFDDLSVPYDQLLLGSLFKYINPDVVVMEQNIKEIARQALSTLDNALKNGEKQTKTSMVPCKIRNLAESHPAIAGHDYHPFSSD